MIEPALGTDSRPSDSRIVVLLVDDQPFIGAAVRQLLKSEPDIELHCCLRAVDAIGLANQTVPTLILQDLIMPDIDGLTMVRSFRTNPQTANTPVVVLSGNDDASTRARALAAGATGYLVKLPTKAALIAYIRQYASRRVGDSDTLDFTVLEKFREAAAPDFTRSLVDQFIHEAAICVRTLKEAAGRADVHALNEIAHSLKGSAMTIGASKLSALCGQVEHQAAAIAGGEVDPALISEIDQELVLVQHALMDHRDGIGRQ